MTGLRVVWTTSGKTSLFPNSTSMFQPGVPPRIDDPTLRFCNVGFAVDGPLPRFCNVGCAVCVFLVSPDLTKAICLCLGFITAFPFRLLLQPVSQLSEDLVVSPSVLSLCQCCWQDDR